MSMYPIATASPTGTNQVIFSSIPQQFAHLQIRMFARSSQASNNTNTRMRMNNDSGSNYVVHQLQGDGSSASSNSTSSPTELVLSLTATPAANLTSGIFGNSIIDVLDYSSTNKNKTIKLISGYDANGSGIISLASGVWLSTSAVTSLTISADTGWVTGSRIDLYGITTSNVTGA